MATVNLETRAQYGELIKGVGVQFMDVHNQSKDSYSLSLDDAVGQAGNKKSALFKQVPTSAAKVHFTGKSGTNYLQDTAEGADFASDSRQTLYKTSIAPRKFTQSVSVTYEAMEDNNYQEELDEFGDLTVSGMETMDKSAWDVLNYAFVAQTSLPSSIVGYGDGKPLCSISHPRKDGGTAQLNTFASATTQLTLTDDNLESARNTLARHLDDRGKPQRGGMSGLMLVVPPELEKTAIILTNGVKRSGTANNDINIYDGIMTVIVSKWLAYSGNGGSLASTAWFLIDPKLAKLMFIEREGLGTHTHLHKNLDQTFYIRARWGLTWKDWRGVFGSLGDESAYAA